MTREEIQMAFCLRQVQFPPGSDDKRFAAEIGARAFYRALDPLTPAEAGRLRQIAHRYRHQLPPELARRFAHA